MIKRIVFASLIKLLQAAVKIVYLQDKTYAWTWF